MLGIFLALFSTFSGEVSSSIGKKEIALKKEDVFVMGFLSSFWAFLWYGVLIYHKGSFGFTMESLPTFMPRLLLEFILMHIAIIALSKTDRSSYSFVRVLTVPFLLIADLFLGYTFTQFQIWGMVVLVGSLIAAAFLGSINKKGTLLVAVGAILTVGTATLFKYDIAHFNTVEAEQFIVEGALVIYCLIRATRRKEKPFLYLVRYPFAFQSLAGGAANIVGSFAYLFAPASVIMAVVRSSSIFWAVMSGKICFKERHLMTKIFIFISVSVGIMLLLPR